MSILFPERCRVMQAEDLSNDEDVIEDEEPNEEDDGKPVLKAPIRCTKQCPHCWQLLCFDRFGTNPKNGELYYNCEDCRPIMAAHKRKYRSTPKGKAKVAEYKSSDEGKASNKLYKSSDVGKETAARSKSSDAGKAAVKRYAAGDAGKAAAKRARDHRTERRHESTAMKMDISVQGASSQLLSGIHKTSPTFIERTSFASESEYRTVVESTFEDGIMTWKNHVSVWELDHKIPREAYDFDNSEDIKRCWSAKNVHALTKAANLSKSWKLVDQYVTDAGVENFPVSWDGQFPDADFKKKHAAKMMAHKPVQQASTAAASEVGESSNASSEIVDAPDSDSD